MAAAHVRTKNIQLVMVCQIFNFFLTFTIDDLFYFLVVRSSV